MESACVIRDQELEEAGQFATTLWSVVLQAGDRASPHAQVAALGALYQAYFYPLYSFVRRKGHAEHDAQDLLHDFFHVLIEKNYLSAVTRSRGRFRTFLLASLSNFLANHWRRIRSQKRGGQFTLISLDQVSEEAELKFRAAAANHDWIPETEFDLEWARTVLARAMQSVRSDYIRSAPGARLFEALKVYLAREGNAAEYDALAGQLGVNKVAVKVAVHRLRRRFQEGLRREIGRTTMIAGEVEDEFRYLIEVLRRQA
jgi:DNA-directed RNA polymerase specialized sigma24 family protein